MTSETTLTPTNPITERLARTKSAVAVTVLFAVNGMILGGYGGVLPSIRDRVGIDASQIALMLFCGSLAGILSMQIGGRLADSVGARKVSLAALPLLIAATVTFSLASTYPIAVLGAVFLGLGNGAMDVAMNALGVQVESARRRPIMSFFHAFWSVGSFVGAGSVLIISTLVGLTGGDIVAPVMITLAVIAAAVLVVSVKITPPAANVEHKVDGVKIKIPRMAWLLAIMALAFGLAEGTATDWSALHITEVANVDSTTGSLGLVAVTGFMVLIRLIGDRLVTRFGRRAVVRFGGACAAVGYLTVSLISGLPMLLVGWALVGFGVGMIAPQVYAAAGHLGGGRVLAVVVTFGYAAFLAGPAVMGFLVYHVGIHHAMIVPAILCAGIVGLAATMPKTDSDLSTSAH